MTRRGTDSNKMKTSVVEKKKMVRSRKTTQVNLGKPVAAITDVRGNAQAYEVGSSRKPTPGDNLLQESISETCPYVKKTLMVKQSRIRQLEDELNEQRKSNACLRVLSSNLQSKVNDKDQRLKEVIRERTSRLKTLAEKLNMKIVFEKESKEGYAKQVDDFKEVVESLGKKVKDQECLRTELQHVNEERANFRILNKELQENLFDQQEALKFSLLDWQLEMEKNGATLEKEEKMRKEKEQLVEKQKKYIETVESGLVKKKEETEMLKVKLEKKSLEMEESMNILNSNLKKEKQAMLKCNTDLEDCHKKIIE